MRGAVLSLVLAVAGAAPAAAQTAGPTAPGTVVANTADLAWTIAGEARATRSNTDRLIVAERLDVRLVVAPGVTAFDLVNAGSGQEAFLVAAAATDAPGRAPTILVDTDRDGRCDPAVDRPLADGRTAMLAAGETLRLVACDVDGAVRVTARAATGSGTPGTGFDGAGDGGGDAVVGPTGAAATLVVGDGIASEGAAPSFAKSQIALAPDGSARAAAGGTIAYTLAARFPAATAGAEIEDPLPAGTSLVPGSLALDGVPLSAAADADAGELAGGAVRVRLGDVAAGSEHRVTFTVTIDP